MNLSRFDYARFFFSNILDQNVEQKNELKAFIYGLKCMIDNSPWQGNQLKLVGYVYLAMSALTCSCGSVEQEDLLDSGRKYLSAYNTK